MFLETQEGKKNVIKRDVKCVFALFQGTAAERN